MAYAVYMWIAAASLPISEQDHEILQGLERSPSTPQGIALRARIVLLAGKGLANHFIARKLLTSRPTVLLWRERFREKGATGLLTIEKRRGRKPEISKKKIEAIIHDKIHN